MFGFLNVNKPPGPTSHDIVARVRRMLGRKVKVGHAGTLDPFAEGVLVLCVGGATRLAEFVQRKTKRYSASIRLGATSTTGDPEGEITETPPHAAVPDEPTIRDALGRFVGEIQQTPPAHSAVKIDGRRAYKLARDGQRPVLPPRTVTISELTLLRYDWPLLEIDVKCGSGTYIRSLASDIGDALGVGGYCTKLTRTAVGEFHLDNAIQPDNIDPVSDLLPPQNHIDLPIVKVDESAAAKIAMGKKIDTDAASPRKEHGLTSKPCHPPFTRVALIGPAERLIAIATVSDDGKTLQPNKVFLTPTVPDKTDHLP